MGFGTASILWAWLSGASLAALLGCAASTTPPRATQPGQADYGDAPDHQPTGYEHGAQLGQFPTLAEHDGARVLRPGLAWLGTPGSSSDGSHDGRHPDTDDGVQDMRLDMASGQVLADLVVEVGAEDPDALLWLNVLVDLNADGRWAGTAAGGEPEWAVQNLRIDQKQADKKVQPMRVPPFRYSDGPHSPARAWMRLTLTDREVPSNWDGSGSFDLGEIEDYLVEISDTPVVGIDCKNPDTRSGNWGFDGAEFTSVHCSVSPAVGSTTPAGLRLVFERMAGGVSHSGLCEGMEADASGSAARVEGPLQLRKGKNQLTCMFDRTGRLPSTWKLSLSQDDTRATLTRRGLKLGVAPQRSSTFVLDKGSCGLPCKSNAGCYGDKVCSRGCCVEPWAPQCENLEAEACGRCCAHTGRSRAADCIRRACAQ